MEYYAAIKRTAIMSFAGTGIAGRHYPQQTNTGTENQTLHVLTCKWELNNENTWTQGGEQHTWACQGSAVAGRVLGKIANACRA